MRQSWASIGESQTRSPWQTSEPVPAPVQAKQAPVARRPRRKANDGLLPPDAVALIYRPCRSAMTSGKAGAKHWVLTFARRTAPFTEALMGWTAGDDPLPQIRLRFPTLRAAVAFAEREGYPYQVVRPADEKRAAESRADEEAIAADTLSAYLASLWLRSHYGGCEPPAEPDLKRAMVSPADVFASPAEVVDHPLLDPDCKREILRRWAWDEYLLDVASSEAMPESRPSRLDQIKAALIRLDQDPTLVVFGPAGRTAAAAGPAG